jgi:serine/threonine protein phosphatase PrpC
MDLNSDEKTVVPPKLTKVSMGGKTDTGKVRRRNEDDLGWWIPSDPEEARRKGNLYIVADGMGGHLAGDRASELAVSVITKAYYEDPSPDVETSLCYAIEAANTRIRDEASEMAKSGMGTTVVCAIIRGHELYVAHVGDSRAYLARGQAMQQLTEDHSWVEDQVRAGVISQEDARTHPQRNIITRSLGNRPEVVVDTQRRIIQEGDIILLCSDGLCGPVRDEEIQEAILNDEPQAACDRLVDLANENGGPDNVTTIVLRIDEIATTSPELVPERYKNLQAAAAFAEQTAVAVQTVESLPLSPTAPSVALPQYRGDRSALKLAILSLLAVVTVALCTLSAGLWSLGSLNLFGSPPTPTTALVAIPATAPKTPLQGNQSVATATPTALPSPPTPTPSPSPTVTDTPPPSPTLAPLAVPTSTFTPLPTPVPPLLLVLDSTALQGVTSPVTMTTSLVNSPQISPTVIITVVSALPITITPPAAPADEAEEWVLHLSSSPAATFTEPVTVELSVAVFPDSPFQETLALGDSLDEQGVTVSIRLGAYSEAGWGPRKFNLLLSPPVEADRPAELFLRAEPQGY